MDSVSAPQPLVTVQIPTFNQAHFIADAVRSALAQNYSPLEVVVSDDASSDGTAEIIEQFSSDPRFRYHRNETNLGRVANYRQALYTLARGDWVLNLDGDDFLTSPQFISNALARTAGDTAILLVFGRVLRGQDEASGVPLNAADPIDPIMFGADFLQRYPPFETLAPPHMSTLYKRSTAMEIDFYRLNIQSTDFDSFYRLMLHGKIAFIPENAGVWRQHESNETRTTSYARLRDNLALFNSIRQHAVATGVLERKIMDAWVRKRLARYFLSGAKALGRRGAVSQLASLTVAICREDPFFWTELPQAFAWSSR